MKLNLGCGRDKIKGYLNCDISPEVNPDKIIDLEKPLNFEANSIEEILIYHTLEHIRNFIPLMKELHRICEKNALIRIKVPFYSFWGQFNDPTHVRFFTPFTFNYFKLGDYSHEVNCDKDMFNIQKVKINFGIGSSSKLNWIINPIVNFNHRIYCRFFAWIFPCAEIYYELKVIKGNKKYESN